MISTNKMTSNHSRVVLTRLRKQEVPAYDRLKVLKDNGYIKEEDLQQFVQKAISKYSELLEK